MSSEHNLQPEQDSEERGTRRAALKKAGLFAGAAFFAGLTGKADAATNTQGSGSMHNNGAMGDMSGSMASGNMMNGVMNPAALNRATQASMLTRRDEMGIPRNGVIKATTKPGRREQNDIAILNFALALEHLEAEFYSLVRQADMARPFLQGRVKDLSVILARDENTHVAAVSEAIRRLGGTPINKPTFQFPANAFVSQTGFLTLSSTLEETGVSAYLGQGPNVRRKDVLNFAASIYGNETRHSGLIRYHMGSALAPRDVEMPLSMGEILMRVRPFFATTDVLDAMMPGGMMPGIMMPR